jgi:hypothetical protein
VVSREIHLKRESGATPGLPRSGKQERTLQQAVFQSMWFEVTIPDWSFHQEKTNLRNADKVT